MIPERIYLNSGNYPLIDLLDGGREMRVLDVGCGAGDNARLIKEKFPTSEVNGITYSLAEADIARKHMANCWVFDIEKEIPPDLKKMSFDVIIFSHILEHLRNPAEVVNIFSELIIPGGCILIAVPNILSWRMRLQFFKGDFQYQSAGELDDTHLRFFTYLTAEKYLLYGSKNLCVKYKGASGGVPLWWLRRHILSEAWCANIDQWGCRNWPNLFGSQVLLKVIKQ